MSTLYITNQGCCVQRRSGQILICKSSKILQNVPETHVRQMILVGKINLTTPVISFCLQNGIEVVFLTQGGKFKGRLNGESNHSVELRKKQYERAFDREFCLSQARIIVAGKIRNQIALLRRQTGEASLENEIDSLKRLVSKAETSDSIESLLGVEGSTSALYFRGFGKCLPPTWKFEKRTAHPPKDEINSLLSLAYTLIYNRLTTNLHLTGFDAYQGYFHQVRDGHAALASDLMEEFRSAIADSLVLRLIKRKQLKPEDFFRCGGEIRLVGEAQKVFFSEFEAKMESKRQTDFQGGQSLSYSNIIKRQIYHFADVIMGKTPRYQPFVLK
jgi:CRISPR-associated protein Cas1